MALSISDILTLAKAGYTAEQIAEMDKDSGSASSGTEGSGAAAGSGSTGSGSTGSGSASSGAEGSGAAAGSGSTGSGYAGHAELLSAIKELRTAIQAQNIRRDGTGPAGPESVEEVLAHIINP